MDVNEVIVKAWLETQGFFVRNRLKYDLSGGLWSSVSDVDLVAYHPGRNEGVAVLVTAWLTQKITPCYIKPGRTIGDKLENFCSTEASQALKRAFHTPRVKGIQRWLVLGKCSDPGVQEIRARFPAIRKIVPFNKVMEDLVSFVVTDNKYLPHESEALQTIRALHWGGLLTGEGSCQRQSPHTMT